MVVYDKPRPYLKRVPIISDPSEGILRYDYDNLYPQRAEEIVRRSYTLKAVIDRVADFLNGEGFLDPKIASLVVNTKGWRGQSLNAVLNSVTPTFAKFNSICLHIGYDLNYRVASIEPIKFEYIRLSLRETGELMYSTNWERDGRKENIHNAEIYHAFNPNPDVVAAQIEEAGGIEDFKGQILYFTPDPGQYPLASFDPVFDHAQAQGELGVLKISDIQNNFLSTLAIIYPGEFASDAEEFEFKKLISSKSGARGAGSRIGIQDKTGLKKAGDIFQQLSPVSLDKLYEFTETSVMNAIMENEAMPKELLGVRPESGMFNQDNMEQAYTYYNAITRNRRAIISEVFSYILQHWSKPIASDCKIKQQEYIQKTVEETATEGALEINDNLKNMSGAQSINFARILRKYGKGEYSREQATVLLRGGFGFTEEEISSLLDGYDQSADE